MTHSTDVYDELSIRGHTLKLDLSVNYQMDEDGVSYSSITSGEVYSERRKKWIALNSKLISEIYDRHYKAIEAQILEEEREAYEWRREQRQMRRDYVNREVRALRAQMGG